MIFAVSMREVMKRYFIEVYVLSDHQLRDYIEQADEGTEEDTHSVNVLFGRSWDQLTSAFAYATWIINGSDEDGPTQSDEIEFILEERNRIKFARLSNYMQDLKFDRCQDEEIGSDCSTKESLLSGKKTSFKFGSCTICLSDFAKGDKVKQVPQCCHTFHSECLEKWLCRKFSCPNCNLEIKASSLQVQSV